MNVILNRTELIKSLKKLERYSQQVTGQYSEKYIVRISFHANNIELVCANGDFIISRRVMAEVIGNYRPVVVPIKLLRLILESVDGQFLGSESDQVELIFDRERHLLEIIGEGVVFSIKIYDDDKFLDGDTLEDIQLISGPAVVKGLIKEVRSVLFAASRDTARDVLQCVYFADEFIATTDGFRVAKVEQGLENMTGLMHIEALSAIQVLFGNADVTISQTNNGTLVEDGFTQLMFNPVAGNFPDVNAIIPKSVDGWFMANKKELLANLKPAGVIRKISDYSGATRMEFKDENSLEISAQADSVGRAVTNVRTSACVKVDEFKLPFMIAVNERMLIDCISHVPGENVRIGFNKDNTPIVIRPDENPESLVMLLMPMHLG